MKKLCFLFVGFLFCFNAYGQRDFVERLANGDKFAWEEFHNAQRHNDQEKINSINPYLEEFKDKLFSRHLAIKGVEINGTLKEFKNKLIQKGCKLVYEDKEKALLSGNIGNINGWAIFAKSSGNLMYQVSASLECGEKWMNVYSKYQEIKDILIRKYGEPIACEERFDEPELWDSDDNSRAQGLSLDKCHYSCIWMDQLIGSIVLDIRYIEPILERSYLEKPHCVLNYVDIMNQVKVSAAAEEEF